MLDAEELRRVEMGPRAGEAPRGLLCQFTVRCPGNAPEVLSRARTVLAAVLRRDLDSWPSTHDWSRILPKAFVSSCAPERTQEEAERDLARWDRMSPREKAAHQEAPWELSAWLYWFAEEDRGWSWWDARLENSEGFSVSVVIDGWPFPSGSLRWLFRASGASNVTAEHDG